MTTQPLLPALLTSLFLAAAHDTWFTTRGPWWTGNLLLRLGTGERFPSHDTGVGAEHLAQRGCRAAGREVPLEPWFGLANALVLHSRVQRGAPVSCWARLSPFEIELDPEVVARYFDEVRPPQAVRDTWAAQRASGVPWRERYVKHARIALFADDAAPAGSPQAELPLDLVVESRPPVPRAGDTLVVRALRDSEPLPDFAVELVGSGAGMGRWLRTDAQGNVANLSSTVPQVVDIVNFYEFISRYELQSVQTSSPCCWIWPEPSVPRPSRSRRATPSRRGPSLGSASCPCQP